MTGTPFFQDVCYRRAFDGARRMEQGAYAEAKKIFIALLERQMPPDPALHVYVLQSLEHCCAECQDFRAAYQYSVKRLALDVYKRQTLCIVELINNRFYNFCIPQLFASFKHRMTLVNK